MYVGKICSVRGAVGLKKWPLMVIGASLHHREDSSEIVATAPIYSSKYGQ